MWESVKKFVYQHRYKFLAGIGIVAVGFIALEYCIQDKQVKLSTFINAINKNYIEEVIVKGQTVLFRSQNQKVWYQTFLGNFPSNELFALLDVKRIVYSNQQASFSNQTINIGLGLLMSGASIAFMINEVRPQISTDDMKSKVYSNNCTFDDFYGGDIIKTKFRQIIDFLKNPDKYQRFGARVRRGVLLYGPPGTGKTMMARALANEAQCEFIKVAASQFQQMFVGVGAKRVRELFKQAKKCEKGCIIFVDEIDALGSRLNHLRDTHETTSTINQFLSQMDGFSQLDKVVVVAATNRVDLIDAAIIRAGRFDIKIQISLPCKDERIGILNKLITKRLKHYQINDQTINFIGQRSEGWCGADLEALVNQSIYKAIRQKNQKVQSKHIRDSLQEMILRKL